MADGVMHCNGEAITAEWLAQRIRQENDCWVWLGESRILYHGPSSPKKRSKPIVVVWKMLRGPISDGLSVRRSCQTPNCVNPEHGVLFWMRGKDADSKSRSYRANKADGWIDEQVAAPEDVERPKTRGDCLPGGCNEIRPCPWVSCKWHLYVSVEADGSLIVSRPDLGVERMPDTCALDVADRGVSNPGPGPELGPDNVTLEEMGSLLGITRERVRQLSEKAYTKMQKNMRLKTHLPVLSRGDHAMVEVEES